MKQAFSHSMIGVLLVALLYASGGSMIYSHYCATTNKTTVTLHKAECEMEKEEKPSCHKSDKEEDPCCTDTAEFQTKEQLVNKVQKIEFLSLVTTPQFFQFQGREQATVPVLSPTTAELPRPPNLRACVRFQQVLC